MAQRIIPEKETLTVEFKSDRKRLRDTELIDTVVALSNTDGGTIYLGVEDDGTPSGVHPEHSDTTRLAALIGNRTIPPVPARVSTLLLDSQGREARDGMQVTVVEIESSPIIVASSEGKIMRRRLKADGSPESVPLYPYEIITRLSTLGRFDYSAQPQPGTSFDDFSPDELRHLRATLERSSGSDRALLELDDESMLAALRMTTTVDGKSIPTATGLLIAGKAESIDRVLPTAKGSFQVLEGTNVRINEDFDGALLSTIERMGELFEPWNPESEVEFGMFRMSVPEFDRRAFREALVNAFGHRDYAQLGRVRVLVDEEGLTISNPGGFIEGVTTRNLLTVEPRGRNESLMTTLKRIGLAEKTGRGVDRIFEGSVAYGRPLPDYSGSTATTVSVFIARSRPDEPFMRMIADERRRTGTPLSLKDLLVLDALKRQRRLTAGDLSDQLNIPKAVILATIEGLAEGGIIEAHGNGSTRSYSLSSRVYRTASKEVAFARQTGMDEIRYAEVIMRLVEEQDGSVTTHDVERLLGINNKQAYRQLKRLVDEGLLVMRGRSRSTRYELP